MSRKMIETVCFVVLGALTGLAADPTVVWWTGAASTDLSADANWEGEKRPTQASEAMGFKAQPSADYTLTLTDDLDFPGTWCFAENAGRRTFDLGGHTLTFRKPYIDYKHNNATNVIRNGTVAFEDTNGNPLEVTFWNAYRRCTMSIENGGRFVGNLNFQDGGTRHLTIEEGGSMRGRLHSRGNDCRVFIRGEGSSLDANKSDFLVGGQGFRSQAYVTDGAVVSNVSYLGVGGLRGYYAGGAAYLCVSNATLSMCPNGLQEQFYIGCCGNGSANHGNRMDVIGGARFLADGVNGAYAAGGHILLAVGDGYSHSNLLYVAGEGTTFSNFYSGFDRPLTAGQNGLFNRIHFTSNSVSFVDTISAGGQAKSYGDSCVTSLWNRVTVDGGATLAATNVFLAARHPDDREMPLYLTSLVASNVFEVLEGGTLRCDNRITCGALYPSFDNALIVRGRDAVVTVGSESGGALVVGYMGSRGNRVEVTDGASLKVSGDVLIGCEDARASNNWVRLDGCSFTNATRRIEIGSSGNAGNRLWVGTGSSVSCSNVRLSGLDSELVLSNGTLHVSNALHPNYQNDSETDGGSRFSFFGSRAKLMLTGGNSGDFTNRCTFAFAVPEGGYASAPVESSNQALHLCDDTAFEFDFSAVRRTGVKTTLFRYSGGNTDWRIRISQKTLERIRDAARRHAPRARVTLSDDRRTVSLRVPREAFLMILR